MSFLLIGFTSGLAGSMAGSAVIAGGLDFPEQMAITALVGYVSAEAAGGDGVQGAINAAIVFLYNHHGAGHGGDDSAQKGVALDGASDSFKKGYEEFLRI